MLILILSINEISATAYRQTRLQYCNDSDRPIGWQGHISMLEVKHGGRLTMKATLVLLASLFLLSAHSVPLKLVSPLDDIENHDEFNVADVEGIGFEGVEEAYRKRGLALPESLGGKACPKNENIVDELAKNEMAARLL